MHDAGDWKRDVTGPASPVKNATLRKINATQNQLKPQTVESGHFHA